jgi:hypothetical protein
VSARRFVQWPLGVRIALVMGAAAVLAVGAGYLVGHALGPLR